MPTESHSTSADSKPVLVTVEEAMRLLRLSRPSLYALIQSRRMRTVRFGRARRVPMSEIDRLCRESFVPLDGVPLRRRPKAAQ